MPFLLGLGAGTLGGYGSYVGWLSSFGVPQGALGWAVAVGVVLFLVGFVFGLGIFILGEQ